MSTNSIYVMLQQKLEELKAIEIVDRHFKTTQTTLKEAYKESKRLQKQLEKENADIEKLEKMSIKRLFHKVLGDKEQQLEKERQEFLEMTLKFKEHIKSIELLEFELKVLDNKRAGLSAVRKEVTQLKKKREKALIQGKSAKGKKLKALVEESDHLTLGKKEYLEALHVAQKIIQHLSLAIAKLRQAGNWGTYKTVSRGRGSSYNQRYAIEQARGIIIKTQHLMRIFKKELQDINVHDFDTRISADQLSGFTNIFFDNLITDWIIQKKIRNTLAEVRSIHDRIQRFSAYLNTEHKKMEKRLVLINKERDQLVSSK